MTQGEIIIMAFQALLITGLGTMFWRRLERLEDRFVHVDARFAQMDARFAQMDARFDQLRSDLTQIALAVGANHPRATEG